MNRFAKRKGNSIDDIKVLEWLNPNVACSTPPELLALERISDLRVSVGKQTKDTVW